MRLSLLFPLFVLAVLAGCQSPTTTDANIPSAPLPAAGSITFKNGSTAGLTLSAYDPADTAVKPQPVATALLVAAGQTALISTIPAGKDFWFHALDDLVPGTDYSLVSSGVPKVFRLSPLRAYTLDFSVDASATPPLVWNWQLAANASYEVSNLRVVPGTNSLTLLWKDPVQSDLTALSVKPAGGTAVTVAKGIQSTILKGLTGGASKTVTITAVYPEIESRGVAVAAVPLAPAVVVVPKILSVAPLAGVTNWGAAQPVKITFDTEMDLASFTSDRFVVTGPAGPVAGTVSLSSDFKEALFTPATLMPVSSPVTATVHGVQSASGGTLAAPYSWSFATAAPVVPTLNFFSPDSDEYGVATASPSISLLFSTPMAAQSLNSATFQVFDGLSPVAGTYQLHSDTFGYFTPAAPWKPGTLYKVTLSKDIMSATGGTLAAAKSWSFMSAFPAMFQPYLTLPAATSATSIASGDVTGDGKPDLIGLTKHNTGAADNQKLAVYSMSAGAFGSPVFYSTLVPSTMELDCVAVGDLNGDKKNEVIVAYKTAIEIFGQDGAGGLVRTETLSTTASYSIVLGDFNHDGRLDLAGLGAPNSSVTVWLQKSDGKLGAAQEFTTSHTETSYLVVGDINADGLSDLLVMNSHQALPTGQALVQKTDGTLAAAIDLFPGSGYRANGAVVGDFNGDGKSDLAMAYGGNNPFCRIGLFFQSGGTLSATPIEYRTFDIPSQMMASDLNGDGRDDLLVYHHAWDAVGVYLQKADGTLDHERRINTGSVQSWRPAVFAVADWNGDSHPDIGFVSDAGFAVLWQK